MTNTLGGKLHLNKATSYMSRLLYFLASLLFILAALFLVLKAFNELYVFVIVLGKIDKDLLDAISYAITKPLETKVRDVLMAA